MSSRFTASQLKIQRAQRHIAELDAEIQAFATRDPIRLVLEPDPRSGHQVLTIRMREHIPNSLPLIIGDAVHNLRVALDLLVCELVRLNGKSINGVSFPFAGSAHGLEEEIKRKHVKRAGADAVRIIRSLQPYKGGNEELRGVVVRLIGEDQSPYLADEDFGLGLVGVEHWLNHFLRRHAFGERPQ